MSVDKREMTKDEFVSYLSGVVDDSFEIGRALRYVKNVFLLQNDLGRPAYIFEVPVNLPAEDIEYIQKCMVSIGVCTCLVPTGFLKYVGEITPEGMGVKNIKEYIETEEEDGR